MTKFSAKILRTILNIYVVKSFKKHAHTSCKIIKMLKNGQFKQIQRCPNVMNAVSGISKCNINKTQQAVSSHKITLELL